MPGTTHLGRIYTLAKAVKDAGHGIRAPDVRGQPGSSGRHAEHSALSTTTWSGTPHDQKSAAAGPCTSCSPSGPASSPAAATTVREPVPAGRCGHLLRANSCAATEADISHQGKVGYAQAPTSGRQPVRLAVGWSMAIPRLRKMRSVHPGHLGLHRADLSTSPTAP